MKTLRLSLLICLGLTGPAVAQEGAAPVANDETSKLIDTMQTRMELYDFLGYHDYERKLDELFAQQRGE